MARTPDVIEENEIVKIAGLLMAGRSVRQVADELKISHPKVTRIIKTSKFKEYVKDINDEGRNMAVTQIRQSMYGLAPKITEAINNLLERNSAEGVKIALRVMGALEQEEQDAKAAPLTVVFPTTKVEKEVASVTKKRRK